MESARPWCLVFGRRVGSDWRAMALTDVAGDLTRVREGRWVAGDKTTPVKNIAYFSGLQETQKQEGAAGGRGSSLRGRGEQ